MAILAFRCGAGNRCQPSHHGRLALPRSEGWFRRRSAPDTRGQDLSASPGRISTSGRIRFQHQAATTIDGVLKLLPGNQRGYKRSDSQGGIVSVSPDGDPAIPRRVAPRDHRDADAPRCPARRPPDAAGRTRGFSKYPPPQPNKKAPRGGFFIWRRGRDSNPRYAFCAYTPLAGARLRPLGHLSGSG